MKVLRNTSSSVLLLPLVLIWALTACSSSSDGGADGGISGTGVTSFNLNITDGPVDEASAVVVEFTAVEVKPEDGESILFEFDEAKSIDLLALQGSASAVLLEDETLAVGEYTWIRLAVNAEEDGVLDSYIDLPEGRQELRVPSGSQTGLKLQGGFTLSEGVEANFTIDFDLRKSLTNPPGRDSVFLKPSLRLIENTQVGSITGIVDSTLIAEACADASVDAGSVYLYSGSDVTPVDLQDNENDPLTTALVSFSDTSYTFEFGFIPAGDYTIAYTCTQAADDPESDDLVTNSEEEGVYFLQSENVSVTAGEETVQSFINPIIES